MNETVDYEYNAGLLPCPFCAADCEQYDEQGRLKNGVVMIERRVSRRAWAEIFPNGDEYAETWAVVCRSCFARGGSRTNRKAAIAAWQTRLTPDMTPEEREEVRREVEEREAERQTE